VQVRLSNSIKAPSRFGYSESESGNVIARRDEALKIGRKDQPDDAAAYAIAGRIAEGGCRGDESRCGTLMTAKDASNIFELRRRRSTWSR
jgi:hypothetical protein